MNKLFKSATLIALVVFGAISTESCKKGEEDPGLTLRSRDGRLSGTWTMMSYTSTSESTTDIEDPDRTTDGNTIKRMDSSTESWDGTSWTSTETDMSEYDDGSESSATTEYAAGKYTSEDSYTGGGPTFSDEETGTYTASESAEYTFEKDGTFSMTRTRTMTLTTEESNDDEGYDLETVETNTETTTVTGTWAWLGANDANEIANEERVALWFESNKEESTEESEEDYTDTDSDILYDYDDDDNTQTSSTTWEWTGTQTEPDEIWSLVQLRNTEMKAMVEGNYTRSYDSENKYTSGGTSFSNSQSEETTGSYMIEITFEKQ